MTENNHTRHIYFEEDFVVKCQFPGGRPDYPWRMVFNTRLSNFYDYEVSFDGQNYQRCYPMPEDTDSIMIEFKCHNLRSGRLSYLFERTLPNDLFSDGKQTRITPVLADIVLWNKPSDVDISPETTVILGRMLKGDPGPGVPAGGTTGQVLTKAGVEDYATEWRSPSSGGDITAKEIDVAIDKAAIRYDSPQFLTPEEQMQALTNAALTSTILKSSELNARIEEEKTARVFRSQVLKITELPYGDRLLLRGASNDNIVYFYAPHNAFSVLSVWVHRNGQVSTASNLFLEDLNSLHIDRIQNISLNQQETARFNVSAVGYLQLSATLGTEADNWPLVVTSSLTEVQAAFEQFWANPGRYRWSLTINSAAEMNPFVEEAELEPLHRDDGGMELQFNSKRSGLRYAIVLTREEFVITSVRVEYLLREEWKAYLAAGASFDPQGGYFKVNGIEDIPLREIEAMYALYDGRKRVNLQEQFANSTVRTNFPIRTQWATVNMDRAFQNCLKLSRVAISTFPGSMTYAFYNCPKLERIIGVLDMWFAAVAATANAFDGCAQLRSVSINRLRNTISFKDSPLLSLESLQYLIGHAANTAAITMTVHSDVYARLIDPTQAEWYALNEQAAARNIAFATV